MDWKLVATTFASVFVAELGDKTQLATLSFATGGCSRWAVFVGSASALVCTSLFAVLVGRGAGAGRRPEDAAARGGGVVLRHRRVGALVGAVRRITAPNHQRLVR